MDQQKWQHFATRIAALITNEARTVSDAELAELHRIAASSHPELAGKELARRLAKLPLGGDLRHEFADELAAIIGAPVPLAAHGPVVEPFEWAQWATVSEATTMERPYREPERPAGQVGVPPSTP